jgi:hypothetical protein
MNSFRKDSFSANVDKNWKDKVCINNVIDCNQNFPNLGFTEFTAWGADSFNGTEQPGWGIKNDLSYIRGAHTFKFGFQHQNQNADGFGQQDIAGEAQFNFLNTSVPGQTAFPASGGSSFASFLLGHAYSGRTETIRQVYQRFRYFGFYAQDDWRISRKLVLNLGLRYDFTLPPYNKLDEYSDFNPTRPNPGANGFPGALWFAGNGPGREGTRTLVPRWWGGWGPRIGLAYTPDNKTTFRTAFARSFSRVTAVQGSGHYAGFIGNWTFDNTSQGVQPTFLLDNGLPSYVLPPNSKTSTMSPGGRVRMPRAPRKASPGHSISSVSWLPIPWSKWDTTRALARTYNPDCSVTTKCPRPSLTRWSRNTARRRRATSCSPTSTPRSPAPPISRTRIRHSQRSGCAP